MGGMVHGPYRRAVYTVVQTQHVPRTHPPSTKYWTGKGVAFVGAFWSPSLEAGHACQFRMGIICVQLLLLLLRNAVATSTR